MQHIFCINTREYTYQLLLTPPFPLFELKKEIANKLTALAALRAWDTLPSNKYINIITTGASLNLNFRLIHLNEIVLYKIKSRNVLPVNTWISQPPSCRSLSLTFPANLNFRLMSAEIKSNFKIKRNAKYPYTRARDIFVSSMNRSRRRQCRTTTWGAGVCDEAGGKNIFLASRRNITWNT